MVRKLIVNMFVMVMLVASANSHATNQDTPSNNNNNNKPNDPTATIMSSQDLTLKVFEWASSALSRFRADTPAASYEYKEIKTVQDDLDSFDIHNADYEDEIWKIYNDVQALDKKDHEYYHSYIL